MVLSYSVLFQSECLLGLSEDDKIKPLTRNCKMTAAHGSVRSYLPLCAYLYRVISLFMLEHMNRVTYLYICLRVGKMV